MSETTNTKPTCGERLAKVARECAYIEKKGQNIAQKYSYVTAADVLAKVNESLARNGLVGTTEFSLERFSGRVTKTGSYERHAIVRADLKIRPADVLAPTIYVTGLGSGSDYGDKAIMKAETAALKYAWIAALNIATGDDPEADSPQERPNHRTRTAATKPIDTTTPAPRFPTRPGDTLLGWITEDHCPMCGSDLVRISNAKGKHRVCSLAYERITKGTMPTEEARRHTHETEPALTPANPFTVTPPRTET